MILQPDTLALSRVARSSERDVIFAGSGEVCQWMLHMTLRLPRETDILVLKINSFMKRMKSIFAKWFLKATQQRWSVLVDLNGALHFKSGLFSCPGDLPDLLNLTLH